MNINYSVLLRIIVAVATALGTHSAAAAVGRTVGQADVSITGEAVYSIRIEAPSGVKDITPDLALTYGHRQEEGVAGIGWTVSGLSVIQRCSKTFAQDGTTRGVGLLTTDRLCLDGNQLRLAAGTYGAAASTYRTEIDTVARITANGTAGNGPAWFKVEHKNGLIYEYGNSANAFINSLASGFTTTAHTWALSKIRDREGNEIIFNYFEDGAPYGDFRINSIQYGGNPTLGKPPLYTITFVYESQPSQDVDTQYVSGGKIVDTKRLDLISIAHLPSASLVRRYDLAYEASLSNAGRSRLQSVQECGGAPLDCLSPTTFTYQNGTLGLAAEVSSGATIPAGTKVLPIDLNGDGRSDLVYPSSAGAGSWHYRLATASGGYGAAVNSGIANTNHAQAIAIDYNSDGLDDVLVPYSGSTWWVIQGSASGLQSPINTQAPVSSTVGNAIAMDMNGDGHDDLVYAVTSSVLVRYRVPGAHFSDPPATVFSGVTGLMFLVGQAFPDATALSRARTFDANGDGFRDVSLQVAEWPILGSPQLRHYRDVILGGGQGIFVVSTNNSTVAPVDINGDGYTDLVEQVGTGPMLIRISTGKSFLAALTGPSLTNLNISKAVATDWNGDGFEDLLIPATSSTGNWYYFRSTGDSFAAGVNTNIPTSGALSAYPVDANGDGMIDIGYIRSNNVYAHRPRAGTKADLLRTATDGNGDAVTFNYVPITQGAYTKRTDAVLPNQDYAGPIYVVQTKVQSTGIGTGTFTTTFAYEGAQRNIEGRQLVGFYKRTIHDSRNSITTSEFFRRDFPYYGKLSQRQTNLSDGTLIRQEVYTWSTKTAGSGFQSYKLPFLQKAVIRTYEATGTYKGSQLTERTTTNVVDQYGTAYDVTTVTNEMTTANGVQPAASFSERQLLNMITNDVINWCLGKPGETQLINSHSETYGAQITRTIESMWNTAYCRLTQEIVEPTSATYKVWRTLGHDGFGNINSETITGIGLAGRTTSTNWGSSGQFPFSKTNALGQTTQYGWDLVQGRQSSETDPNGIASSWQYDKLGRISRIARPDGTYTDVALTACSSTGSYCGTGYSQVKTRVRASHKDASGVEIRFEDTYLDKLDRPIQSQRQTMSGAVSMVRETYDTLGRISQRSVPVLGATPVYNVTITYDVLNRPTLVSRPIDSVNSGPQTTSVAYLGLTTNIVDAEGKSSTRVLDAMGRVARSIDHAGYYQQFDFDAFGSLRRVGDSLNNTLRQLTYAYGLDAFPLTSTDMDMGAWSHTPNPLGEVVGYSDAKLQSFTMTYDKLSRPLTRTEPEGQTTWTWGTSATAHNIGRLASVAAPGHSQSFTYDTRGRLSQHTTVSDASYQINYAYSASTGLLDTLIYPVSTASYRLKLQYGYQHGILQKIADFNAPTTVFWQANATDARGNVIDETLGNGVQTIRGVDPVTGLLDFLQSGPGGSASLQSLDYRWNKVGSLAQRQDANRSLTEDFYYDTLNRLDYSELNGVQNLDLSYDALGNVSTKSDTGTGAWSYHATKKHAVTGAGGASYTYDANGNQITRAGQTVTWMSYNYPKRINVASGQYHEFSYDADRARWKQLYVNGGTTETTIYVAGLLEKRTKGTVTEYRHTITAGGQPVALYTRPSSGTISTEYFLLDHLGSVDAITSSTGAVVVAESFSAFGERRNPSTWSGPPSSADQTAIAGATPRGYTFHTGLEASPLVHMNGRVFDAKLGRFLSADPYVPDPFLTQSFNRYSYVNNEPLSFTDPSGFVPCFGPEAIVCVDIVRTVFGLFKGKKRPPPKGCFVAPSGCYGQAGQGRTPGFNSTLSGQPNGMWGSGRFGSGPCGEYCLSWGRKVVPDWEVLHEGAIIFWPGYDLGTCISSEGDCGLLDWTLGVIGVIPGGKGVSLGVKGAVSAGSELLVRAVTKNPTVVIGKVDELKNLAQGERSLLGKLPDLGSPKANWAQNSSVLREEMSRGLPIRDASVDITGALINNTGFLRAERNVLQNHGWIYDPSTTMWYPPAR